MSRLSTTCRAIIITLVLFGVGWAQGKAPVWKVDVGEKIINHAFLQGGRYLFFTNGKWMWSYDAKTGVNQYKVEVPDFVSKGIHQLVADNTKYLVSSGDKVVCYDPATGKSVWAQQYPDVSQGDFTEFDYAKTTAVLRYGEVHIGIDLATGKELWRTNIKYKGELAVKGTYNSFELYDQNKFLVMEQDDKASLFDVTNGKKLFEAKDFKANNDLIEHGQVWYYKSADQKFMLLVLDDGAGVIDVVNNKVLLRHKFDIDGDHPVVVPTNPGCAVLGKDLIVHFNFETGQVVELKFPVGDIRTLANYQISGNDLMVFGMDSKMAIVDLVAGKLLWESKKDDKNFEGYAHEYLTSQDELPMVYGNNIVFTYTNPNVSGDEKGSNLYLMSVDAFTGKVNYRTKVALGSFVMTSFTRGLAKTLTTALSVGVAVGSAGIMSRPAGAAMDKVSDMMGWKNIGFTYEIFPYGENILVAIRTTAKMLNPSTRDDGGEGFCLVNPKTGQIVYKDYFELCDEGATTIDPPATRGSIELDGSIAYSTGNKRIVAFDLAAGKRLWTIGEKELKEGYPIDLALIDGVLYCKFGKIEYSTGLDKDNIKVSKGWKKEPYGFLAIDPANGSILWRVETKTDPGFSTPRFSIHRYYSRATKLLYFADEENVYGLRLGRDGGKYAWTYSLEKNNVGKIEYENSFAVNKTYLGSERKITQTDYYFGGSYAYSVKTDIGGMKEGAMNEFMDDALDADISSTYESWGNYWGVSANHCLRVLYNGSSILAVGPKGIGSIEPVKGSANWVHKWDYDKGEVQLLPQVVGSKIVYCVKKKMTLVDLGNGAQNWQAEEASKPGFFFAPDNSYVFSIDDQDIGGYNMQE